MGREIRRVPKGWQHPRNERGEFQPLYDRYYGDALAEWFEWHRQWERGEHPDQLDDDGQPLEDMKQYRFFAEWYGDPPDVKYYRHDRWTAEEACCYQVYETVSEGSPRSPVFETLDELKAWLVTQGYSEHSAAKFCELGWVPSLIVTGPPNDRVYRTDIHSLDTLPHDAEGGE